MAKKTKTKVRTKTKSKTKASARRTFHKAPKAPARTRAPARKRAKPAAKALPLAAQLAHNKQLVLDFYHRMIGEKNFEAAQPYMGAQYRQHAPYAADGHAGVAEWVRKFKEAFPQHRYEVKKVIAEGDFVVLHLHGMGGPNPYGESVVDIFRIENGKVVEHWDVIQAIPESADNANTMF